MEYLHKCAEDFQEATKHDTRRQIFIDLFQACDYGKVGKAAEPNFNVGMLPVWYFSGSLLAFSFSQL